MMFGRDGNVPRPPETPRENCVCTFHVERRHRRSFMLIIFLYIAVQIPPFSLTSGATYSGPRISLEKRAMSSRICPTSGWPSMRSIIT
jgi:hypothetical protein